MSTQTTIELKNIDPDDINDVLKKIEKSFGVQFGYLELNGAKTFGELCDIITKKVQGVHFNDCTTQQAFYKLRNALATVLHIDKDNITPFTSLELLFPRNNRRRQFKQLQEELKLPVNILNIKGWLGWTIFCGIILSLIMLFFKWQYALAGLGFFIAVGLTMNKFFANEMELQTVGQLAEKLAREHYFKVRRTASTINRMEIASKVKELFIIELDLDEKVLTRQATFN